ncbi:hypothetical protein [Streptomyces sp. NPDC088847]|uniref:hypothetical protein n=1 Tax=Streptomyces sp. NPDC088847 TaxID=3365909 RepID=UPI0038075EE3
MSTVTPADWQTGPAPHSAQDWIARAAEVAALLDTDTDTDAAARDRAGATPHAEVRLLKDSGLVTLLGPTEHGGGGQDWPDAVTAKTRGDFEVRVAAVKARATDVALEIDNRVFEVTGARSTATTEGLDRFWRNVRTRPPATRPPPLNEALRAAPVGLHDPVAYKRREVGRRVLEGELPEPTWYS